MDCNMLMLLFLMQESTYGTHIHEKREEREARFCNTVHDIVNREGRCLIPVFALGRAQELLLILGEKSCVITPLNSQFQPNQTVFDSLYDP